MTTPKAPVQYLNNKTLLAHIKTAKEAGYMTDQLATSLMLLTERFSKHGSFVNYSYIDDMRGYAMLMLVKTWKSFDPEKSDNPFAFFTQCIKNSFIQFLNKEKVQRSVRDQMMMDSGLNPSHSCVEEHRTSSSESYDDEQDFDTYSVQRPINRADERFGNGDEAFEDDLPTNTPATE